MTVARVIPAADLPTGSFTNGSTFVEGNRFYNPAGQGYCTGLSWYRFATGTPAPVLACLWRVSDGALLFSAPATDNGAIGWQRTDIANPIRLDQNQQYCCGIQAPASFRSGRYDPPVNCEYPLQIVNGFWRAYAGGPPPLPNSGNSPASEYAYSADVDTTPAPVDPGPIVANELADWLSTTDNTHPSDGLPWRTDQTVAGIAAKLDPDGVTVDAKVGPLETYGSVGPKGISAGVEIVRQGVSSLSTQVGGLGGWATVAQVTALQADVDALAASSTANFLRLMAPLAGFPSEFSLVDEWDFLDCIAQPVPADVYVLHVTSVPRGLAVSEVCGVPMLRRCGWWAPLADTLPGERHYLDFQFNLIGGTGVQLPGILIELGNEGEGHLQAYVRT